MSGKLGNTFGIRESGRKIEELVRKSETWGSKGERTERGEDDDFISIQRDPQPHILVLASCS